MPRPVKGDDIGWHGENQLDTSIHEFRKRSEDWYSLEINPAGIVFEVGRLRRSSHELYGELKVTVNGNFPHAKTIDGVLVLGDLNFSSVQARHTRAKLLAERAQAESLDWYGFVEELSIRLMKAEREGNPDINLQCVPRPGPNRMFEIDGVQLPLHHPVIVFGDGGAAKSYMALYWAGHLINAGHRVIYLDWEFTAEEHRERLELLFGENFPAVRHLDCYRSIRDERDRIKGSIDRNSATYVIFDSIGVACGGDPNSSEAATSYHQVMRSLGDVGSLHIAHVTKAGDDQKPFGSAFWHNMARLTYNVKGEELDPDTSAMAIYPRKRNLRGRKTGSLGFKLYFGDQATTITPTEVRDFAVLAEGLPLWERIADAVKFSSKTRRELSEILGVDYDILQRTIHREIRRGHLVEVEGTRKGTQRIALKAQQV